MSPGTVFRRSTLPEPPVAVEAHGSTIRAADGREYLDAAGGAIVVNVGHGRSEIAGVMADQATRLAYAHGSAFTTEPVEAYAAEIGPYLPVDDPAIYTRPWTAQLTMTRSSNLIYEYACHEGNYSMGGILAGARSQEKRTANADQK